MAAEQYHLVFRGEVLEGHHRAVVAKKLAALLKMDAERIKALFSGKPVVIKKHAEKAVAAKYQAAFKQAGARLRIMPADAADRGKSDAAAPPRNAAPEAEAAKAPPAEKKMSLAERLAAEEAEQAPAPAAAEPAGSGRPVADTIGDDVISADAFGLSAEGEDLVSEDELDRAAPLPIDIPDYDVAAAGADIEGLPQAPPPPPPDVSALSFDDSGADLSTTEAIAVPEIDTSAISVADVGSDMGELEGPPPVPVDVPDYDVAEAGADLEEVPKPPPPPPPDTSHLHVEQPSPRFGAED